MQQAAWAAQAEGYDGPALRELAAYEWTTKAEVGDHFARALAETGRPPLTRDEAARRLAREVAARILAADVDPYQGACKIYRDVCCRPWPAECPRGLGTFEYLVDTYQDFYS